MFSDESTQLLEAAGKLTPIGAWIYEVDHGHFHWSDETYRIFGREPGSPQPTRDEILSYYHADDGRRISALLDRALRDGMGYEHQSAISGPDGTLKYIATRATCSFGPDGAVTAIRGSIQDITHLKLADAELRASEARHRLVTENSQDLVVQCDVAGVIAFVSPSVQRWGYQASDLIGRNIMEFIAPEEMKDALVWVSRLISGEVEDTAQARAVRCRSGDGEMIWFEGTPALIRDGNGQATGIVAILHDATARREVELRAREQAELFEAAFQFAGIGQSLIGKDQRFLRVNEALCRITGYAESELLQLSFAEITHPDDRNLHWESQNRLLAGEISSYQVEKRYIHADGSVVWARVTVSPIRNPDGSIKFFVTQVEDRSERRAAELARLESESMYRMLAENIGDIIIKTDLSGIIEYVSPSIKSMTGLDPNAWLGKHVSEPVVVDEEIQALKYFRLNKPLPVGRDNEFQYRRADGSKGWAQGNPTILRDAQGAPIGIVSVVRDVTERRAIEDELRRKTEEAQAAVLAKSEFLANMSHEIRTPLTAVIGFGDLLAKMSDLPEKPRLYAERIARSGDALLGIVNDVLDFSRIEAGELELKPEAINATDLAGHALDQLRDKATGKGLTLALDLDGSLPDLLMVDRGRFGQVLTNLLANAVKFTREGGVGVRVGYDPSVQQLRVSVSDTGIGIPRDKADRLFERFSQLDATHTRRFGGVGLGLAISKSLVEAMGGQISFESEEGVGSTFRFTVHAPIAKSGLGATIAFAEGHAMAPLKILVVDDVAVNRELIAAVLEPFDLHLAQAADGLEAVDAADQEPFDLILMDMQMPRMNGLTATQAIRARSKFNRAAPILALSANVLPQHVEECLRAGMNDHVAKPIRPEELLTKIGRWAKPRDLNPPPPAP